jgi:hypothetical protein
MEQMGSHRPLDEAAEYCIRVQGQLDSHWSVWFDGLRVEYTETGDTLLRGWLVDQAALHGVLRKIRDLHLTLLAVTRVDEPTDLEKQERKL